MGQHKLNKRALLHEAATQITRELIDAGKLIEAGARLHCEYLKIPANMQEAVILAFMSGAEHVFNSMMNMFEEDKEPTETDFKRMDLIHKEIETWRAKLHEAVYPAQGNA